MNCTIREFICATAAFERAQVARSQWATIPRHVEGSFQWGSTPQRVDEDFNHAFARLRLARSAVCEGAPSHGRGNASARVIHAFLTAAKLLPPGSSSFEEAVVALALAQSQLDEANQRRDEAHFQLSQRVFMQKPQNRQHFPRHLINVEDSHQTDHYRELVSRAEADFGEAHNALNHMRQIFAMWSSSNDALERAYVQWIASDSAWSIHKDRLLNTDEECDALLQQADQARMVNLRAFVAAAG